MSHILYFFPENLMLQRHGNNVRALELLKYFKDRGISVDFVSASSDFFAQGGIEFLKEEGLIENGYVLETPSRKKNQIKYMFKHSLPNKISYLRKYFRQGKLVKVDQFRDILEKKKYDKIVISYVFWSHLIDSKELLKGAELIIDTHDFITAQYKEEKKFKTGAFLDKELELLNKFDKILTISVDEKYIFSQFLNKEVIWAPHPIAFNGAVSKKDYEYDLIYVASDNVHNVKSAKWFFENVYPLLNEEVKICVIGKVSEHIEDKPNIIKLVSVDDLTDYYKKSKIAICPMLSGTGLKIKVVEAMSYGLPVVCNERGLDGLSSKYNNGCLATNSPSEFAENIHKLLSDNDLYNKVSEQSVNHFMQNYERNVVYKMLDSIFIN
ncbi:MULTISPECIES: glycosyltransferase [Flavobacterium]|uniref:glycosyltransferase n=1 Tax=Flavobacterium TaxID=237 RepID=UPI001FCB5610|nr:MULTISPECIES: glycosyltransferase [Flavobacterium]UOK41192.1 glycosyltransferase [Flavobacterium enshiense]